MQSANNEHQSQSQHKSPNFHPKIVPSWTLFLLIPVDDEYTVFSRLNVKSCAKRPNDPMPGA